jgi:hypothetical protein
MITTGLTIEFSNKVYYDSELTEEVVLPINLNAAFNPGHEVYIDPYKAYTYTVKRFGKVVLRDFIPLKDWEG